MEGELVTVKEVRFEELSQSLAKELRKRNYSGKRRSVNTNERR